MFARGLVRERAGGPSHDRVLLVANARPKTYPLPLCETISRLTAEELTNGNVAVDAFYRTRSNQPQVLAAARRATLIVYEGHIGHQELFPAIEEAENNGNGAAAERPVAPMPAQTADEPVVPTADDAGVAAMADHLDGLPIAILQACDALKPDVVREVHRLGGVALLGGTTPVHSGSGSLLAKALLDAALYEGRSLGEALADAQNFLFCVQELRRLRGHDEMAKVQRVALSFRLWGDPELRVFRESHDAPQRKLLSARWASKTRIEILAPGKRLPPVSTDEYTLSFLPGGKAAGIVQRTAGGGPRKVLPAYFFRLPLPEGWHTAARLEAKDESDRDQVVTRVDPTAKVVYLLYFPEHEKAGTHDRAAHRRAAPVVIVLHGTHVRRAKVGGARSVPVALA